MSKASIAGLVALLALAAAATWSLRALRAATATEDPFIREIQEATLAIRQGSADAAAFRRRAAAYHELGKL